MSCIGAYFQRALSPTLYRLGLTPTYINVKESNTPTRSISVGCDKGEVYLPQRSVSLT